MTGSHQPWPGRDRGAGGRLGAGATGCTATICSSICTARPGTPGSKRLLERFLRANFGRGRAHPPVDPAHDQPRRDRAARGHPGGGHAARLSTASCPRAFRLRPDGERLHFADSAPANCATACRATRTRAAPSCSRESSCSPTRTAAELTLADAVLVGVAPTGDLIASDHRRPARSLQVLSTRLSPAVPGSRAAAGTGCRRARCASRSGAASRRTRASRVLLEACRRRSRPRHRRGRSNCTCSAPSPRRSSSASCAREARACR